MKIDQQLSLQAVHERLGMEAASDYEAQVMRDVLMAMYPGRDLKTLDEKEWLTAYGEMNKQKETGWIGDSAVKGPGLDGGDQ